MASTGEMYRGLFIPTVPTLRKYGMTVNDWKDVVDRDGPYCGACGRVPATKRLVIDHEHAKGWKNMPPADRQRFVRGLLCWTCNGYRLSRGATPENLRGAAEYLERYYERRKAS